MKFTVETEPFHRMLQMLGQALPPRTRRFVAIRLEAAAGRLRAEQGQLAAEMDAMIWEEGRCGVAASTLKKVVASSLSDAVLVVELEHARLQVGAFAVPCVTEYPPVRWRRASGIYFASALGTVPSEPFPFGAVA